MNRETIIGVAFAIIVYQAFVTFRIVFSRQYTSGQKLLQVAVIWLLPLIGAVVCHIFLDEDMRPPKPRDTSFTPDTGNNPPGIGPGGP